MKGEILPDKFRQNKYEFTVNGLGRILATSITGLEELTDAVDLPDRTRSSGGRSQVVDFEIVIPAHHRDAVLLMEGWRRENLDPVTLTAKKSANVILQSDSGASTLTISLSGVWPTGHAFPDLERENDGELAQLTFPMSADQILSSVFA